MQNLSYQVQMNYRDVKYHNQVHASDVVNHLVDMIYSCEVKDICMMTPFDIIMTILSGAAHDMDHPGTNNQFEIKN